MWRIIGAGKFWTRELCHRARDGSLYRVHAVILPNLGADGRPSEFVAILTDITARAMAAQRTSDAISEARHQADVSQREVEELQVALDDLDKARVDVGNMAMGIGLTNDGLVVPQIQKYDKARASGPCTQLQQCNS